MKILTYRELESKDGLVPLLDHAFNWVFNQRQFERFVKIDPRLGDGPVSFCAVENGRIVGHVGVMNLATRTIDGTTEYVGGIFGVATLPGYNRRGVSTALMKETHRYFMEKHHRFAFLATSPALIAHAFYEKLGYTDLVEYPSAYKVIGNTKRKPSAKKKMPKLDLDRIIRIYKEFSKDKTGLVLRDAEYFRMLVKIEGITAKHCMIDNDGYVIFRRDKAGVWIRELVALDATGIESLVSVIEERARGSVYDRAVLNDDLLGIYRSRGYMIQTRGYSVMMIKPLSADASFKETYGDKFYLSRLDVF